MKKLSFCRQCKFYGGKGKCNHPAHGGEYVHVNGGFWCGLGEFKSETN